MEVLTTGPPVIEQAESESVKPVSQVEVLVEKRETQMVEAADAFQRHARQRDVGCVEVEPTGGIAADRGIIELDSMLEPAHEGRRGDFGSPLNTPQDSHLWPAALPVPFEMGFEEAGGSQDVIPEKEHDRCARRLPASVSGRRRPCTRYDEVLGPKRVPA